MTAPITIQGTWGADVLTGTQGNDVISGHFGGDDILFGDGGDDLIYGHQDTSLINGGTGSDRIWLGTSNGGSDGAVDVLQIGAADAGDYDRVYHFGAEDQIEFIDGGFLHGVTVKTGGIVIEFGTDVPDGSETDTAAVFLSGTTIQDIGSEALGDLYWGEAGIHDWFDDLQAQVDRLDADLIA